jgi:hypothetical protein
LLSYPAKAENKVQSDKKDEIAAKSEKRNATPASASDREVAEKGDWKSPPSDL